MATYRGRRSADTPIPTKIVWVSTGTLIAVHWSPRCFSIGAVLIRVSTPLSNSSAVLENKCIALGHWVFGSLSIVRDRSQPMLTDNLFCRFIYMLWCPLLVPLYHCGCSRRSLMFIACQKLRSGHGYKANQQALKAQQAPAQQHHTLKRAHQEPFASTPSHSPAVCFHKPLKWYSYSFRPRTGNTTTQ